MKMLKFLPFICILQLVSFFLSCKSNINLNLPAYQSQIVVEGYIENGQMPIVKLTRSVPYFQPYTIDSFYSSYIHKAIVIVSDGAIRDTLVEFDPTPYLKGKLGDTFKFFAYVDANFLNPKIKGQIGKTYTLDVYANGHHLTGITTINSLPVIDSIYTGVPVNSKDTSRRAVFLKMTAPNTLANYFQFYNCKNLKLTGIEPVDDYFLIPQYAKNSNEFSTDLVKGKQFIFPATAGFHRKDTALIKFIHIDYAQYDYWTSVAQSAGGQGSPFSSPSYIVSNVTGGIGIWAGLASTYTQVIIKK